LPARAPDIALDGLSSSEADSRFDRYGPNLFDERRRLTRIGLLVRQLKSPLLLILVFAAMASALTAAWVDSVLVIA
jgi:P-type Mg2+ transporter